MPYLRYDFDEVPPAFRPETPPPVNDLGFHYEAAEATFDPRTFSADLRRLHDFLRAAGFATVRGRYDGGYDEGFAYFTAAAGDAGRLSPPEAAALLTERWSGAPPEPLFVGIAPLSVAERSRSALDDFAFALAIPLLGEGFGTGEYALYGRFIADLNTGTVRDDPDALLPDTLRDDLEDLD